MIFWNREYQQNEVRLCDQVIGCEVGLLEGCCEVTFLTLNIDNFTHPEVPKLIVPSEYHFH